MKYENITTFKLTTKASKSKIYRFYKKNEELWNETQFKYGKRLFPVEHARYFDSEIMHDENKLLRQENHAMRNLIDNLVDKDSLQFRFWQLDWSFFTTVAYQLERNPKSCYRQMFALYEHLEQNYDDSIHAIIEPLESLFTDRNFNPRTIHMSFIYNWLDENKSYRSGFKN
jgi:hypothetical protein